MKGADFFQLLAHCLETPNQILGQMFAFAFAHFNQLGQRGTKSALHGRPRFAGFDRLFRNTHYAWRLQDHADRDLARRVQFFLQCAHRFVIGAREFRIEREFARAVRAVVISHDYIGSPARDVFIDHLANAWLEISEIPRQIDNDVALFPIH